MFPKIFYTSPGKLDLVILKKIQVVWFDLKKQLFRFKNSSDIFTPDSTRVYINEQTQEVTGKTVLSNLLSVKRIFSSKSVAIERCAVKKEKSRLFFIVLLESVVKIFSKSYWLKVVQFFFRYFEKDSGTSFLPLEGTVKKAAEK